jgi:hypothetical protein
MRINTNPGCEAEIISDGYPSSLVYEDTLMKIQSKMFVKGDVNVDVGCGNAFGGKK